MKSISPSKTKTYKKVKSDIEDWVKLNSLLSPDFKRWYCGITRNPLKREMQHKYKLGDSPCFFKAWNVKSLRIASSLETHFHVNGMKDKDMLGNAKYDSIYIYVYKKYPTILDMLFK